LSDNVKLFKVSFEEISVTTILLYVERIF